ncbi:MAG: hypothetical protein R2736_13420 [Solirubrobacterales bacterium]
MAAAAGARIEAGDYADAVAILLPAYDRAYRHRAAQGASGSGATSRMVAGSRLRRWPRDCAAGARCHDR